MEQGVEEVNPGEVGQHSETILGGDGVGESSLGTAIGSQPTDSLHHEAHQHDNNTGEEHS